MTRSGITLAERGRQRDAKPLNIPVWAYSCFCSFLVSHHSFFVLDINATQRLSTRKSSLLLDSNQLWNDWNLFCRWWQIRSVRELSSDEFYLGLFRRSRNRKRVIFFQRSVSIELCWFLKRKSHDQFVCRVIWSKASRVSFSSRWWEYQ